MAFQSPYRDPPPRRPSLIGEGVSRGIMFAFGLVLAWVTFKSVMGMIDATAYASHAATQQSSNTPTFGRRHGSWFDAGVGLLMLWAGVVGLGVISGTLIAAALLPVGTMQSLFERWNRPPVTGDRGGSYEYGWRRWWFDGWWWP